mmetsp:Transcript_20860/g.71054  ORF Transcript_20860/g.71054 Transcript_20860/m.71054 type:complete len:234 (-) Transcript_20860:90-791(-)
MVYVLPWVGAALYVAQRAALRSETAASERALMGSRGRRRTRASADRFKGALERDAAVAAAGALAWTFISGLSVRRARAARRREREEYDRMQQESSASREQQLAAAAAAEFIKWKEHEERWLAFAAAGESEGIASEADVPWPPQDAGLLGAAAVAAGLSLGWPLRQRPDESQIKQQHKRAVLRWHPDKFTQKFGKRLDMGPPEVRRAVLERVSEVAKALSAAHRKLGGGGGGGG